MTTITFLIPPHLQFRDYVNPSVAHKAVQKQDGKSYGNLITDMPLGPLALSSYLKKHVSIEPRILDFNVELNSLDAFSHDGFKAYFEDYFNSTSEYDDTELFAISCLFSPSYQSLIDISQVLKSRFKNAKVMAGGNIPSNMYKELYAMDQSIDYICYGEGELPMLGYLTAENPDDYVRQSTSWITYEKSRDKTFVPEHDFIWDLDEIPIYDYELCGTRYFGNPAYTAYGSHQDKESNYHILTSRGCPFLCVFCASHKVHGRKMRYYSIDRVKEDITQLKEKFGLKTLIFQDDHFMGDQKRALEIVRFVGGLGIQFIFQNSLALYALNREFLQACKEAGMDQLVLSVESGSARVLKKVMKKPLKLSIVEQVVKDCRELGIYTYCNIVIGLPGETKEDMQDTRAFLKTTYANWFGIYCANPLVGSEMFDICVENDYLEKNWIGSDYKQAVISTTHWDSQYVARMAYQLNLELNIVQNSDYRLGDYPLALDGFERVIRAKSDHALAYLMAAKCLFHMGKREKSQQYLNTVKEICSTNSFWQEQMEEFGIDLAVFDLTDIEPLENERQLNSVVETNFAQPGHFTNH